MKRSTFIKKVLKNSTVFVNEEQINATLRLFERLGVEIVPPETFPIKEEKIGIKKWDEDITEEDKQMLLRAIHGVY